MNVNQKTKTRLPFFAAKIAVGVLTVIGLGVRPSNTLAERSIVLPFSLKFDTFDYSDLIWDEDGTGTGCVAEHSTAGCYEGGGCFRVLPPTSDGINACSLGAFNFANTNQLNVRFLLKVGTTFASSARAGAEGYGNKFVLIIPTENTERPWTSLMRCSSECDSAGEHYFTPCSYDDTNAGRCECVGQTGYCGYPYGNETFYWGDGIGNGDYAGQWVSMETEVNISGDYVRTYITTQDGIFNDTLIAEQTPISATGYFNMIQLLGGYWNQYSVRDPNNYLIYDNLDIGNLHIGSPIGFVNREDIITPSNPKNLSVR